MDQRSSLSLEKINIFGLFAVAFLLRIFVSPYFTHESDFAVFLNWSRRLQEGFPGFYNQWSDYLPGYLYVLWILGKINALFPALPQLLLYKLPAIIADMAAGAVIFWAVSRFPPKGGNKKLALLATSLYLFNPAVFANSAMWGQIDGITALFILLAVFLATSSPIFSSISLGLGVLVKPQAGFMAPFLALLWLKKFGFRKTLGGVLISTSLFLLGFLPFADQKPIFLFILERLGVTSGQYPYTSVNAFNFWALLHGFWKPDAGWSNLGILITALTLLFLLGFWVSKKIEPKQNIPKHFLITSLILVVSFLFLTRMHERHLLPALAPLAVAAAGFPLLWISYFLLSATYIANLYFAFIWLSESGRLVFSQEIISIFIFMNFAAVLIMVWTFFKPHLDQWSRIRLWQKTLKIQEIPFLLKHSKFLLTGIILFALLTRVVGLNFPGTFYFDEVYHAFTAREMLRGNPVAWEWWNNPPPGFAYEWTHPPLAKLFMAAGMMVVGENSLGWRLPGALLGAGVVFLVYLLGVQLFKSRSIGLFAAAVFSLDGLPLAMSRIGMNDTYFLFFALLALWLFLKERYLLSSVALGLAAASKWTTLWVIPILFLAMLLFKIKPRWNIFWLLFVPPLVYLASYIPFFTSGHTVSQFIELQKQMWWYHTGLVATHSYQSTALSWPLMLRPVWLFTETSALGGVANIYTQGNPLVFWGGLAAIISSAVIGILKRQKVLLFVVVAWGLLFLPWAFSPRVMFLYHYLPALPFLSLALGWLLSIQKTRVVIACFALLVASYIFFFPHWTGIFVPKWFDNLYYLLPNWK